MDGTPRLSQTLRVIDDHSGFRQRGEQICRIVWVRYGIGKSRLLPSIRVNIEGMLNFHVQVGARYMDIDFHVR